MAKGSEMIVDYLSVVVKERSAAVAVMTLPVDPPASSQQHCRQKFATERIIFIENDNLNSLSIT